jgi:nucleoside phosphorylase
VVDTCEFGIICAKSKELRDLISVLDHYFEKVRSDTLTSRIYRVVPTELRVQVTTCNAMGHLSAAIRTSQILATVQPSILIFLGTAASLKASDVQVGGVVIPRKAISRSYEKITEAGQPDYDLRKKTTSFEEYFFRETALISDLSTTECAAEALTAIASLQTAKIILERGETGCIELRGEKVELRMPRIHDDIDIFSCGMVIDSVAYREFLSDSANVHLRKTTVVDMESYGFFKAIEAARFLTRTACSGIMVRGISDYAGRKYQTEALPQDWKRKSVRNAAIVAVALLQQLAS